MRLEKRHIGTIQALMMLAAMLLLAGCTSEEEDSVTEEPQPAMLQIYVYAPDHMLPTRGNTDWVQSATEERNVNTLQIWVFEHGNGNLVGYFTPPTTGDLNTAGNAVYQMAVTPQFVQNKPNVDVYVLANVTMTNCKCAFDANTTRTELEGALLQHEGENDPFGLPAGETPTAQTTVPADGLPMTGVLRDQVVSGESPVLRIGDGSLATVQLVRTVSKIRFIFSQMKNNENVMKIKSVSLTGDILPKQEYLFLDAAYTGSEHHVKTDGGYDGGPAQMVGAIDNVASTADPLYYSYSTGMGAQEYETLITTELTKETPDLTLGGTFYLRESDKKLTGEIKYTVTDADNNTVERTATFSMHDAGDFSRNHTWVVYAFYGSTTLDILVVRIKEWSTVQELDHTVYNW